jgi:hypothetical protein
MLRGLKKTIASEQGSALVIALLVILSLTVLVTGYSLVTNTETNISSLQQRETKTFYIAQTALDRSIKQLMESPGWRDGFTQQQFEGGTYDVKVYDSTDDGVGVYDPSIPANYVKVVATATLNDTKKEVEALWVNPLSAFNYAYSAGNRIQLDNHGTPSAVVTADMHNNSWQGDIIKLDEGTTVYGNVSAVGDIIVGNPIDGNPCLVYGNVWGNNISITNNSEVRKYENLDEMTVGRDLNGDGDTNDTGLTKGLAEVHGATSITSGGTSLSDGDTDVRIAGGSQPVTVGGDAPAPIIDPRPDFGQYYELVTGTTNYPPGMNHVSTPIPGDGDGHYFASTAAFTNWLNSQGTQNVYCWRCAGDGLIGPSNSIPCPTCGGTGSVAAVVASGVFYIDDAMVDLSTYDKNVVLHGSIVVAQGDPNNWPSKTVSVPGGTATIDHFPQDGRFILKGAARKNFTQTYRSDQEGGPYAWNIREVYTGSDKQTFPIPEPEDGHFMRNFPSIITPIKTDIHPRESGSAYYQADIGDEVMTILQGVMYSEGEVHMHGSGGSKGTTTFDETKDRKSGDKLDEKKLATDLNGDGDMSDKVRVSDITTVPVIPAGGGKFNVDIDSSGTLEVVTLGMDYNGFFRDNGYEYPVLLYHEGILLGQKLHTCEHYLIIFDPLIAASGIPFGFNVNFGSEQGYKGLVSWRENTTE